MYAVNHTIEDAERRARIAVRSAHRKGEAKGRQEGLAEGMAKGEVKGEARGHKKGLAEGEAKGEHRLATLISKLLTEGRMGDIEKASTDQAYRNALFAEYGI